MTRAQQSIFAGIFVALIVAVPVVESAADLVRGRHPRFLDVFLRPPTRPILRQFEKQLEDESPVARAMRPWMQYTQFALFGDMGEKVLAGKEGWLFYKPDLRYLVEPPPQDPRRAVLHFRDQLAAQGIQLMVVPVPGKPAVYGSRLTRRVSAGATISQTRDLIAQLRQDGVETVDLFALFDKLRSRPEPYYLLRDTHWSAEAAEMAAAAVAGRLQSLGWVEPGLVEYAVRPVRSPRKSDIARMIRAPLIEAQFSDEVVACRQVLEAATGQLYRDDPASPVLVLGDSFLRMYQTDAPRGAGFIAHLARLLRQPVTSVVNDGGASTLVRQELARRPALLRGKKVVVWEFVERDIRFGTDGWQDVVIPPPASLQPVAHNPGGSDPG